jgi:hypothetical protein
MRAFLVMAAVPVGLANAVLYSSVGAAGFRRTFYLETLAMAAHHLVRDLGDDGRTCDLARRQHDGAETAF